VGEGSSEYFSGKQGDPRSAPLIIKLKTRGINYKKGEEISKETLSFLPHGYERKEKEGITPHGRHSLKGCAPSSKDVSHKVRRGKFKFMEL